MRYYVTCISSTDEEILIIAKGNTEEEAHTYLKTKYKVKEIVRTSTKPPTQDKNYYASFSGVHGNTRTRTTKRGVI